MAADQPAFRTVLSRFTMSSKTHRTDGACQRPRDAFHPRARHRGHSGIGDHSPCQTVSSRTSQSARDTANDHASDGGGVDGRAARKAERGRLLMARNRLGRRN
jgi:hypothetical protein